MIAATSTITVVKTLCVGACDGRRVSMDSNTLLVSWSQYKWSE